MEQYENDQNIPVPVPHFNDPVSAFKLLITFFLGLTQLLASEQTPFGRLMYRTVNYMYPNMGPTFSDAVNLYIRKRVDFDYFKRTIQQHGYTPEMAFLLRQSSANFLSLQDYVTLYRRGYMELSELDHYTDVLNLDRDELTNLLRVTEYFPQVQDLIRFAVREVYTDKTRIKYGMDEDRPQKFLEEGQKAGLPPEQAANFWAAHWELPSPNMGYEMLHRGVIGESELLDLLKALDIMPYWRDKLMQISYNVITRVDVRRMYSMGIYDYDDVLAKYKEMGYNDKDAKDLTEFTVVYESDETTGLTRASLINSYKDDMITEDELREYLLTFRYTETVTEFWIDQANYEKTFDTINRVKTDLINRYRMGTITVDDIQNELNQYSLPAQYVDRVVQDVIIEKAKRQKVPSLDNLLSWLDKLIITEDYFVRRMRQLGYSDEDIRYYLTEFIIDKDTTNRRFLKVEKYQEWLKKGFMSVAEFTTTLQNMKMSDIDINNLIMELQE